MTFVSTPATARLNDVSTNCEILNKGFQLQSGKEFLARVLRSEGPGRDVIDGAVNKGIFV